MNTIFKSKSLLLLVAITSSMMFFSCQKDNPNDASPENPDGMDNEETSTAYHTIQAPNGQYLSSENGEKPVNAIREKVGDWEKFQLIDIGSQQIIIKGSNGKYLTQSQTAENGATERTNIIRCVASKENAEKFVTHNGELFPKFFFKSVTHSEVNYALSDDGTALESPSANPTAFTLKIFKEEEEEEEENPDPITINSSKIYVVSTTAAVHANNASGVLSSENGEKPMSAIRTQLGGVWEILTFEEVTDGGVYIKGSNGKYLTSVDGTKALSFIANTINEGEKFVLQSSEFPKFFFKSVTFPNKAYKLSSDLLRLEPVAADQQNSGTEFKLENAVNFTAAFKAPNGNYLSSENGEKPVSATRTSVEAWEKIQLIALPGRNLIFKASNGNYLTTKVVNEKEVLFFSASLDKAKKFSGDPDRNGPIYLDYIPSSDGLLIEKGAATPYAVELN